MDEIPNRILNYNQQVNRMRIASTQLDDELSYFKLVEWHLNSEFCCNYYLNHNMATAVKVSDDVQHMKYQCGNLKLELYINRIKSIIFEIF